MFRVRKKQETNEHMRYTISYVKCIAQLSSKCPFYLRKNAFDSLANKSNSNNSIPTHNLSLVDWYMGRIDVFQVRNGDETRLLITITFHTRTDSSQKSIPNVCLNPSAFCINKDMILLVRLKRDPDPNEIPI